MVDNNIHIKSFPNIGYLFKKFTEEQLKPIKEEINEIQLNFNNAISFNYGLAGNIEKEYLLVKCKEYLNNLIIPLINAYDNKYEYLKEFRVLHGEDFKLELTELWVNFMKKHEFNPPHNHTGIYSFVLWIEVPYNMDEELKNPSTKNSNTPLPGHFQFLYNSVLGSIKSEPIPVDESFNGVIVLFPSKMVHSVNPFYTSDKYRISVAGNFKFNITK
jgi:hypothetical protein